MTEKKKKTKAGEKGEEGLISLQQLFDEVQLSFLVTGIPKDPSEFFEQAKAIHEKGKILELAKMLLETRKQQLEIYLKMLEEQKKHDELYLGTEFVTTAVEILDYPLYEQKVTRARKDFKEDVKFVERRIKSVERKIDEIGSMLKHVNSEMSKGFV
jgi:hypothetical protein